MSKLNKTEFDALTNSVIVPTVTNAIHITHLEALTESVVLKKHRVGSITLTGATQSVDFTNYETYLINRATLNCSYTISGLAVGQIGHIQFSSTGTISFTNVTLFGENRDNGSFRMNPVTYTIMNINGTLVGFYSGSQTFSLTASLNCNDLIGYTTDFVTTNNNTLSNDPFSGARTGNCHIRTRQILSTVTIFEFFFVENGTGDYYQYVGRALTTSIDWTLITSIT